jgi:hypothetical protein
LAATILLEAALRLETLPAELLLELGAGFFSPVTQKAGIVTQRVRPSTRNAQLGLRLSRQPRGNLEGHAALVLGVQQQRVTVTEESGSYDFEALAPHAALSLGGHILLGPGRVLAQVQFDISPTNVEWLRGGLSGIQVLAGYLITLR